MILFVLVEGVAPLQRADASDWWFDNLNRTPPNFGLFWKAHDRTDRRARPSRFSPDAKDLIQKILDPNPKTRATIEQIQAHPWYTAARLEPSAAGIELQQRLETWQALQNKEVQKHRAMRRHIQELGCAHDHDDDDAMRTVSIADDDADHHTHISPRIVRGPSAEEGWIQDPYGRQSHAASYGKSVDDLATRATGEWSEEPPPVTDSFTPSYTQFESRAPAKTILARVIHATKALDPHCTSFVDRTRYSVEIHGSLPTGFRERMSGGPIQFDVQIGNMGQSCMVTFRRLSGSALTFSQFYSEQILCRLANLIQVT